MYYIPQLSNSDCGLACLKMVLASINDDKGYLFINLKEKKGQCSYKDIIDLAAQHSLNLKGFKVDDNSEIINCQTFPLIVSLNLENGAKHSVVVEKIKHKKIYVLDPDKGPVTLSLKKFENIWDGTGLIIDNYEKENSHMKINEPYRKRDMAFICVLEAFSGLSLILASMFMCNESNVYIPIFFCLTSIIFEISQKISITKAMRNMDALFLSDVEIQKGSFKDFYLAYQEYKKEVFLNPVKLIFILITCLFIATISLLNSPYNIVSIAMPICLSIIDVIFFNPYFASKDLSISKIENEIISCADMQDFLLKTDKIHEKAYKNSTLMMIKKYIYMFLMVATALLTAFISKIMNIPSVVFFICVEIMLYENMNKLFSYSSDKKNKLIAKAKMYKTIKPNKE